MSNHCARVWSLASFGVILACCLGCGTREYEKQLERTVARLKAGSPAGPGQPAGWQPAAQPPGVQLPDTTVTVQVPPFFAEPPLPQHEDARRLKPPSIDVPGLKLTYEGLVTDSTGGQMPFYCYLGATAEDPQWQLQQQVQAAFPGATLNWESVQCDTPYGEALQWKVLTASGQEQEFRYLNAQQQESYARMPAKLLFYVRQEGGTFVIVGWRTPASIEQFIGLDNEWGLDGWAQRVAGSVTSDE
jgi:hypothetical protein